MGRDDELVALGALGDQVQQCFECQGVEVVLQFLDEEESLLCDCQFREDADDMWDSVTHRLDRNGCVLVHIDTRLLPAGGGNARDHVAEDLLAGARESFVFRECGIRDA